MSTRLPRIRPCDATPACPAGMRWVLIGASDVAARRVLPALKAAGNDVRRVYSSNAERARGFAQTHGLDLATADLSRALDDGIDAVYVSSRHDRHCADVLAAAEAGRHILCEKPLATTVADAVSMVRACDEHGVVLATNHHLRGSAVLREMARQVASGAIGAVLSARVQNAIELPERLRTWRLRRPDVGGVCFDLAVHDIDALRFILGRELQEVTALSATQRLGGAGIEDAVVSAQRYDADVMVAAHESYTVPTTQTLIEVHGSEGSILALDALRPEEPGWLSISDRRGRRRVDVAPSAGKYEQIVRDFCDGIATGRPPAPTGRDGAMSLLGALALRDSAVTGRRVSVDVPLALKMHQR
jgi:1,5-anhydro-D-fructose reductase (1,5-anhydro-D-mannitol-forming)